MNAFDWNMEFHLRPFHWHRRTSLIDSYVDSYFPEFAAFRDAPWLESSWVASMVRNACHGRLFHKTSEVEGWISLAGKRHHATNVRTDLNPCCMSHVSRSACGGSFICARILSFSDSRWVWVGKRSSASEDRWIFQSTLLGDFTIRIPFFVPWISMNWHINYQTSRVWSKAKGIATRFCRKNCNLHLLPLQHPGITDQLPSALGILRWSLAVGHRRSSAVAESWWKFCKWKRAWGTLHRVYSFSLDLYTYIYIEHIYISIILVAFVACHIIDKSKLKQWASIIR